MVNCNDAYSQLPKELKDLTLLDLPLKSQYRALLFYGLADGSNLNKAFDVNDLRKRFIVIKSFKIVPYTVSTYIDFFTTDSGATETWSETIPANSRVNRVFDNYNNGAEIKLIINGMPLNLFTSVGQSIGVTVKGYPGDLFVDNLFYLYPEKLVDFDISVDLKLFDDIDAATTVNPNLKVVVECYLI